ncbi:MAG: hypothetical protein AAF922_17045 [Pseudomonadota bacterium]
MGLKRGTTLMGITKLDHVGRDDLGFLQSRADFRKKRVDPAAIGPHLLAHPREEMPK